METVCQSDGCRSDTPVTEACPWCGMRTLVRVGDMGESMTVVELTLAFLLKPSDVR